MFNKVYKNRVKNDKLLKVQKEFEEISKKIFPTSETRDKIHSLRQEYQEKTDNIKNEYNDKIKLITIEYIQKEIDLLKDDNK